MSEKKNKKLQVIYLHKFQNITDWYIYILIFQWVNNDYKSNLRKIENV